MGKKLAKNVQVGDTVHMAGSTPPKEIADQITNPKAWESDDSADDSGSAATGYTGNKAELEAEVAKRNADRDEADQIVVGGNGTKADLVKALEADDANQQS